MFWNLSWPAVSQIESLTENPRCSITCYYQAMYQGYSAQVLWPTLTLKSKPTVGRMSGMNLSSVNLNISEDLPTPAAPSTNTLRLTRLSEHSEWPLFMWHSVLADPEFWAVRCWGWACPDTGPGTGDSSSCPGNTGSRHCDHWGKSPDVSKHIISDMRWHCLPWVSWQRSCWTAQSRCHSSVRTCWTEITMCQQFSIQVSGDNFHIFSLHRFCLFTRPSWLECLDDSERIGNTEHLIILCSDWSVMTILNPHWRLITFSVIFLLSQRRDDIRELSSLLTAHGYHCMYMFTTFKKLFSKVIQFFYVLMIASHKTFVRYRFSKYIIY